MFDYNIEKKMGGRIKMFGRWKNRRAINQQ